MPKLDYSVLVFSCDAYSDAWEGFFHFYHKNWPNPRPKTYLCSNFQSAPSSDITTIKTGTITNWSDSLLLALDQISSPYILWLQEDYFLTKPVDTDGLAHLFSYITSNNLDYFRLIPVPGPKHPMGKIPKTSYSYGQLEPGEAYRTSLQAAFWKKDTLRSLLVPGESGWQFEKRSIERSAQYPKGFASLSGRYDHEPMPMYYLCTAIVKGRWVQEAYDLCLSEGIPLDLDKRRLETWHIRFRRRSRGFQSLLRFLALTKKRLVTSYRILFGA